MTYAHLVKCAYQLDDSSVSLPQRSKHRGEEGEWLWRRFIPAHFGNPWVSKHAAQETKNPVLSDRAFLDHSTMSQQPWETGDKIFLKGG